MTNRPHDQEEGDVATESRTKAQRPPLFKVYLHNDDYTTQDFVVSILETIFHHAREDAIRIMMQVHTRGIGVAGLFSFEIAEAKVSQVHTVAREHDFPLRSSSEPE